MITLCCFTFCTKKTIDWGLDEETVLVEIEKTQFEQREKYKLKPPTQGFWSL